MPRRAARLVKRYPRTFVMIPFVLVLTLLIWRVEHLAECIRQDGAENAQVIKADNGLWFEVNDLVDDPENRKLNIKQFKDALKDRVDLARDLDTSQSLCWW